LRDHRIRFNRLPGRELQSLGPNGEVAQFLF
jgi:hypothetical protein